MHTIFIASVVRTIGICTHGEGEKYLLECLDNWNLDQTRLSQYPQSTRPTPAPEPGRKSRFGKEVRYHALPESSTSPLDPPTNRTCRDPSKHHHRHLDCRKTTSSIYINVALSTHDVVTAPIPPSSALRERISPRMATPRRLVAFIATGPTCPFPTASQPGHFRPYSIQTVAGL